MEVLYIWSSYCRYSNADATFSVPADTDGDRLSELLRANLIAHGQ